MATDARTADLGIEKPHVDNKIAEDLARIALGLEKIDAYLKTNIDSIAGKADAEHDHEIGDVEGLEPALGQLAQDISNVSGTLEGLEDTEVADVTQGMLLQYLNSKWQAVVARASFFGIDPIAGVNANNVQEAIAELAFMPGDIEQSSRRFRWNHLLNGAFTRWIRASSQTTSGYGSDDRWLNLHIGSTKVHSRFALSPGGLPGFEELKYFSRTLVTSVAGAGNCTLKAQRIKDVRTLADQEVTVVFLGQSDAPRNIAVEVQQHFGTGGTPSDPVTAHVETVELATTFDLKAFKFTMPSISGKTLGTSEDTSFVQIGFWFEAGSDFDNRTNALGQQSGTFDITAVAVVGGDATGDTTAFHDRGPLEDILCDRFCRTVSGVGWTAHAVSSSVIRAQINYPPMAAAPDVTLLTASVDIIEVNSAKGSSGSSITTLFALPDGLRLSLDGFTGLTVNNNVEFNDARDILLLEAEI